MRAGLADAVVRAYAHTRVLEVPDRPFSPRCCALGSKGLRLETEYVSFNTPNVKLRLIAPHPLVYTGMRWRVRAYCEKNGQYRDFVLSRLRG